MSAVTVESWVGIDWGHEFHQVCLVKANGGDPREKRFPQSVAGLVELVTWLRDQACSPLQAMQIAIERPHGPVVETLLLYDFAVFAINPKQLDRFRDPHTVAGLRMIAATPWYWPILCALTREHSRACNWRRPTSFNCVNSCGSMSICVTKKSLSRIACVTFCVATFQPCTA
jgi:hypothetical protein